MKILKTRWFTFLIGCLLGAFLGGAIIIRASNIYWNKIEVGNSLMQTYSSIKTISATENKDDEFLLSHQPALLRGSFLMLIALHRSGNYQEREREIEDALKLSKRFMLERPALFMEKEFYSGTLPFDEANSTKATETMQKGLKEAFEYVDSLPLADATK